MDREIAPEVRQRKIAGRVVTIVVGLAAAAFFLAASIQWLRPSVRRNAIRTARVERGSIDAMLQASGTIMPAGEKAISSPVEARVLRIVRRAGDRVRSGDDIIALDTSASRLDLDRLGERVAQQESARAQLRLKLEDSTATLRAQHESKQLDVEILKQRALRIERLFKEGLSSDQDLATARAEARKSEIEYAQIGAALARALRSSEAQLQAADMEVNILRRERDESQRQLNLAMTRADRDGVVTWVIPEEGATVRRGDVVARVADLSAFRVLATISDLHVSRISSGMRVRVRIDEQYVDGTITSVDPRIENGVARFYVDFDAPSDKRLRNNVRVDVFVVTGRREGVLRVARGSLGQSQRDTVFVVRGDRAVATPMTFGLVGEQTIEVVDGAKEGDELVISDMTDYKQISELRLK
jgi:HlyD family secretion protein